MLPHNRDHPGLELWPCLLTDPVRREPAHDLAQHHIRLGYLAVNLIHDVWECCICREAGLRRAVEAVTREEAQRGHVVNVGRDVDVNVGAEIAAFREVVFQVDF